MEHEVFVPVLPEVVRQTLADPARVARCVPGLQQDADQTSTPLTGRLKVRVGGHTITYRGALGIAPTGSGGSAFAVSGEGSEARGNGSVKLTLTVRAEECEGGTRLHFSGTAQGDGRIAGLDAPVVESAVHRLLDRFAARLGDPGTDPGESADGSGAESAAGSRAESAGSGAESADGSGAESDADSGADAGAESAGGSRDDESSTSGAVQDAVTPPPSLDRLSDAELDFEDPTPVAPTREDEDEALREALEGLPGDLPDAFPEEPPAEAAHARRTMIGRSAEEVDHAPPRGRYAPVMAPAPASGTFTLRRLAPAAALAVASAVVVGRALRRRR